MTEHSRATATTKAEQLERSWKRMGVRALPLIIASLQDRRTVVRWTAASLLGEAQPTHQKSLATRWALKALSDRSSEVRFRATESLSTLLAGTRRVPAALRRAADDHDELVRIAVAEALGEIRGPASAAGLRRTLGDISPSVRAAAARSLGPMAAMTDRAILERMLLKETHPRVRTALHVAIAAWSPSTAVPELEVLLQHHSYQVRCAVANALPWPGLRRLDRTRLRDALTNALRCETTNAARDSMRRAIARLSRR
jgi:HEAT repeat protein